MTPSEWQSSLYLFDVIETNVPLVAGNAQACLANSNRIALWIGGPGTGGYNVSTSSSVTTNSGFFVNPGAQPFQIYASAHGALVTQAWFVATGGLASSISVLEILFKDR